MIGGPYHVPRSFSSQLGDRSKAAAAPALALDQLAEKLMEDGVQIAPSGSTTYKLADVGK